MAQYTLTQHARRVHTHNESSYLLIACTHTLDSVTTDVDGQMMRKDLAVHKEMVAELRQELTGLREQFTDKEKELKV